MRLSESDFVEVAAKVEAHQATHTGDFGSYYYRYALTVIAADQVHVQPFEQQSNAPNARAVAML